VKIYRGYANKLSGPRTWYLIVDDNIGYYWGPTTGVFTRTVPEDTQEVVDDKCYQEIGWLEFMITHGMTKGKIKRAIKDYKRFEQVVIESCRSECAQKKDRG